VTRLIDRKLLVVTGKGGTGKTVAAVGLARLAAKLGKRVLLCEVDGTGDIGRPYGVEDIGFNAKEVEPSLFLMQIDTEAALQEYLQLNLKLPLALRVGPLAKIFDFVATAAPGVREILTMGKVCWEVKRENYDLVVLDAPSTGHVLSQLASPDSIGELITVGPLLSQTAWMREMLRDPMRTGAVIVTTPEEMPVSESIHLAARLRDETRTPLAAIVVNRVLPQLFSRAEATAFDSLALGPKRTALDVKVPGNLGAIFGAAELARRMRDRQVVHVETLRNALDGAAPFLFVPQNFESTDTGQVVEHVFDALAGELE